MRYTHVVAAFALVGASAFSAFPVNVASAAPCDGPAVAQISMRTSDGVKIAGFLQGTGTVGVVLVHQVNKDHCGWAEEAAFLARRTMVLSLDLRGYGASAKGTGAKARVYRYDIAAAVAEVRKRGVSRVLLVGASMGGSAVVVAGASIKPAVDAVVAVSAPANFQGQNAAAAAPLLTMPVRFVAARDDGTAAATADSLTLLANASADARAEIYPAGGHGWTLMRPGKPAQEVVDSFLDALVA